MQLDALKQSQIVYRSINLPKRSAVAVLPRYSPEKIEKMTQQRSKLRSSTSSQDYSSPLRISHNRRPSLNRSTSVHSHEAKETVQIPTRARQFNEMVNKKRSLLRIKHKIKGASDHIPNILDIRQSVRQEEADFMRRMDAKLHTLGNANLLVNLKKDFRIKSQNYLREMSEKNRRNLKNMKRQFKNQRLGISKEQYVTLNSRPLVLSAVSMQS